MRWLLSLSIVGQISISTPASAEPWTKFTEPNGQFSVMFPAAPEMMSARTQTFGPGEKTFPLKAYITAEDGDKVFLMVVDIDLTGVDKDAEKILDEWQAGLSRNLTNGTTKATSVDGVSFRRLSSSDQDGMNVTMIFFFWKNHLYEVGATTFAHSKQDSEDAQRFSDSLHFNR